VPTCKLSHHTDTDYQQVPYSPVPLNSLFLLFSCVRFCCQTNTARRKETIINNKRKRKRETNIVRLHLGSCELCDSTARWAPINYENKKRKEEISSRYVFVVSVVVLFACQRHTHLPRFSYFIPFPSPRYPLVHYCSWKLEVWQLKRATATIR
jgi:hypothetical protein